MNNEENGTVHMVFKSSQIVIDYYYSEPGDVFESTEELEEKNIDGHQGTYRRTEFKDNVFWEFLSEGYVWIPLTKKDNKDLIMELDLAFDLSIASTNSSVKLNYN